MKKVLAITLALVIVLSLAVTALAIDNQIWRPLPENPGRPILDPNNNVVRITRNTEITLILNGPEEEQNPTTGAPVVLPACAAVAVLAGVAYAVSKRK